MEKSNDDESFKPQSGKIDKGRDYEYLNIAYITLNLLFDTNIKNFKIASNTDGFGKFDDIIMELEYLDDSKEEYLVQLKHAQNHKKTLNAKSLSEDKGDFSIKKYLESYRVDIKNKNSKMILYTNVRFEGKDVDVGVKDFNVKGVLNKADPLLCTSKEQTCTRFEIILSEEPTDEVDKNFFKNFSLYTDQANSTELKTKISEIFCKFFKCDDDTCNKYLHFINEWSKKEGKKLILTKLYISQAIVICLVSPFIHPVSSDKVKKRFLPLQQAIAQYHVTSLTTEGLDKVSQMWKQSEDYNQYWEEFNKIKAKFYLRIHTITEKSKLSGQEISLLLWLSNKSPLIIFANPTTTAAIKLFPDGKYIVLEKDNNYSEFKRMLKDESVFQYLSDLDKKSKNYNNIVKKIQCYLQGREISLEALLEQHEELIPKITINELLRMLDDDVFAIGEDKEELPKPHIQRNLSTTIIDVKYLKQIEKDDSKTTVVISCNKKKNKINKYLENVDLVTVENYIRLNKKISSENKSVFYTEGECSQEDFDKICTKNKSMKQCHHFRIADDGNLEWIKSKGNVEELEPFLVKSGLINEYELYSLPPGNNINVICANPGIGKSTLTKSLKNKLSTQYWAIIINPTDVSTFCREKQNITFEDYIETKTSKRYTTFDKTVMSVFKQKKMITYIWDGLDEISDDNLKKVLEIIDNLSKKGVLQWITSRWHLKDKLEIKFNVFSRTIQQFDENQQRKYICHRLKGICKTDISNIVEKIRNNIEIIRCQEVLGIPLQIYMLTELFRQDPEKYTKLLSNTFSLTDLYHHFVNEKFNRFYKEKANIEDPNDSLQQILETYKASYIKKYEKAALKSLDEPTLQIDRSKFLTKIKKDCDGFGLITNVSENMYPTFVHNSYGEYFVACYFYKKHRKIDNLKTILFKERYANIRFLFDLLMANDSEVHIAVLYKNLDVLKDKEHFLHRKDEAGRNVLQVACTWGQRYPVLNTTPIVEEVDTYKINEKLGEVVEEETTDYQEIIKYLVDKCDHEEKDELFEMDSAQYADTALCLFPFSQIAMKTKLDTARFTNFKDVGTLLYYGIQSDSPHILELFPDIPLIKTEKRDWTLIHLCAEFDSQQCLTKLLEIEKYRQMINNIDIFDVTAANIACKKGRHVILKTLMEADADLRSSIFQLIQLACKGGHNKIVELLLKYDDININQDRKSITSAMQTACLSGYNKIVRMLVDFGADINVNTRQGIPLYIACKYGHEEIVNILLTTNKAHINKANKFGFTPFHIACQRHYVSIVKKLLTFGVDVNVVDNKGLTPLYIVSKSGNAEMLQLLLDSKADVNKASKKKMTPLHICCQSGYEEIARMLINVDANVNLACSQGCTPMYLACESGHKKIVELLLASGADVNIANAKNVLPQDISETNGFDDIVRILEDFVSK